MPFRGVGFVLFQVLVVVGCGGSSAESDGRAVFEITAAILHEMHVEAFGSNAGMPPATYEYACDVGRVVMTTVTRPGGEVDLLHQLEACVRDGDTFSGTLDYLNFEDCGPGFAFDIRGELTVPERDIAACVVMAREECDGSIAGIGCESP